MNLDGILSTFSSEVRDSPSMKGLVILIQTLLEQLHTTQLQLQSTQEQLSKAQEKIKTLEDELAKLRKTPKRPKFRPNNMQLRDRSRGSGGSGGNHASPSDTSLAKKEISEIISPVSSLWQKRAFQFLDYSHKQLLGNPEAIKNLSCRGISVQSIESFHLGWNPQTLYDERSKWDLPIELNHNGNESKIWLPQGIVIPAYEKDLPVRIKIRRSEWHEEDQFPKYVEISGSFKRLPVYGDISKPVIVMESELDAILVQQYAADLCCCVALGGVGKRPDQHLHQFLKSTHLILLALDYDEAGKKDYPFWMSLYPTNLHPWPAPKGKSPGDAHKLHQADLRKWVEDGLYWI